jgi:uncharacterized protein (TIGR03000 family)
MYSLILLTALSTGADVTPTAKPTAVAAPVSSGCCGVTVSGCCGYSVAYGSCYGSCHGSCHGGLFSGIHGCHGLFSHHNSCHGYGYSCCGGYACTGCYGYYGSTWGPPVGMPPYTLHGYNQGGMYGYGPPVIWGTVTNTNAPPTANPTTIPPAITGSDAKPVDPKPTDPKPTDPKLTDTKKPMGMGANLKFRLPADTKLYIDGRLTTASGTERVFSTPPLALGQKFFYDVKAELMVKGSPVVEEMRVIVESGTIINESFTKLFVAAQLEPAVVAGK